MGPPGNDRLARNLADVRRRMAAACARAGRDANEVTLVAVTKTVGVEAIRALRDLGVGDVGENRVQDAGEKRDALGGDLGLRWHLIGHLQTNKARHALRLFSMVHSVDSVHLAEDLERRAAAEGRQVPVLVQCNVSGEETKFGVAPADLLRLVEGIAALARVQLEGLMTMAPFGEDPEASRPVFAALRELAAKARAASGLPLPHLSMGMTQDFEVAIEEGATLVRIGTALFRREPGPASLTGAMVPQYNQPR